MKNKILLLLIITTILLLPLTSSFEFDNVIKEMDNYPIIIGDEEIEYHQIWEKYVPIKIDNWLGLGSTLMESAILDHTETCSYDCQSKIIININQDMALIEDIYFKGDIINYKILIKKDKEKEINDYKWACSGTLSNGTSICGYEFIGNHKVNYESLEEYKIGEIYPPGKYTLIIYGNKKPNYEVDWVIKSAGKYITDWAVWAASSNYQLSIDDFDDANIDFTKWWNVTIRTDTLTEVGGNLTLYGDGSDADHSLKTSNFTSNLSYNIFDNYGTNNISIKVKEILTPNPGNNKDQIYLTNGTNYSYIVSPYLLWGTGKMVRDVNISIQRVGTNDYYHQVNNSAWSHAYLTGNVQIGMSVTTEAATTNQWITLDWVNASYTASSVTLNSPDDSYSTTSSTNLFNCTAEMVGATFVNKTLWTNQTGTWNITNYTVNNNNLMANTFNDGTYLWSCQACDSDGDCGFSGENRSITIDASKPNIKIVSGNGTYNYGSLSLNHSATYNITDNALASCWIEYNLTNTTVPCVNSFINQTNITLELNVYNATIWANDSAGNKNYSHFEWTYNFFEGSSGYTGSVYETSSQEFFFNISTPLSILSASGYLKYNGSSYLASSSCSLGLCSFYKSIDIPLIINSISESANYTFNWELFLYNGSNSAGFNTTTYNQNATKIHLELCNGTYNALALNFTTFDEQTLERIFNFSIETTLQTWLGSGSVRRNQTFQNATTPYELDLCLYPNDTTNIDGQLNYFWSNSTKTYKEKNYYFQNNTISNVSQNIKLYLLDSTQSTSFILKVQDQQLRPINNALIYIQRYYPGEGVFKVVQIAKTDSDGESVGFFEIETVDYKFTIIKDGITLLNTESQKIVPKEVPYTLTFTVGSSLGYPWTPFQKNESILSNLTYNQNTSIVTFTYIDLEEGTELGRLLVVQESNINSSYIVICNVTSIQPSATLTCNMAGYNGTYVAYGYLDESISDLLTFIISQAKNIFGNLGLLITLFFVLFAGFAFIWNPSAGIVFINVVIIFTSILGFIIVSPIFIFSMIFLSIIILGLLNT